MTDSDIYKAPNGDLWGSAGDWIVNCIKKDVSRVRCINNPKQFEKSKDIFVTLMNRKHQ